MSFVYPCETSLWPVVPRAGRLSLHVIELRPSQAWSLKGVSLMQVATPLPVLAEKARLGNSRRRELVQAASWISPGVLQERL